MVLPYNSIPSQEWLVHFFLASNTECKQMRVALSNIATDFNKIEVEVNKLMDWVAMVKVVIVVVVVVVEEVLLVFLVLLYC